MRLARSPRTSTLLTKAGLLTTGFVFVLFSPRGGIPWWKPENSQRSWPPTSLASAGSTGADEDRTLARLRALRSDLIDPTIDVHNGRVVKRTGDGALVEFRSVVDAVRCAIEVQNAWSSATPACPPDRRIEFRIGIHLGDVVEESDGDLMGDGVNIAARLEGVASPGAICLSEDAYRQVQGAARSRGQRSRRDPAQEHRRAGPRLFARGRRRRAQQRQAAWPPRRKACAAAPLARKPSIAVLAFNNMSGDPEQEYFSDGISEDIITDLSTLSGSARRRAQFVVRLQESEAVDVPTSPRRSACAMCSRAACARRATGSASPRN